MRTRVSFLLSTVLSCVELFTEEYEFDPPLGEVSLRRPLEISAHPGLKGDMSTRVSWLVPELLHILIQNIAKWKLKDAGQKYLVWSDGQQQLRH